LPPEAEQIALGRAVYDLHCAACHGADLEGQPDWRTPLPSGRLPAPPHDASGHTWHHPDAVLFRIVRDGTAAVVGGGYESDMPGFGEILDDAEIEAVLAFIRSTWPERERRFQREITRADEAARAGADEIIEAQEREIAEMGYLIAALEGEIDAPPQRIPETEAPVVSSVAEALAHADLAVLTPAPLNPNEVARAQVGTPSCTFRYTADSPPVLVVGAGAEGTLNGVMKLNGALIPLRAPSPDALRPGGGAEMTADRVTMTVIPAPGEPVEAPGERELRADLVFALVEAQTVGYRGFYRCRA
jgi:mono/diheme cytochrome c family protein